MSEGSTNRRGAERNGAVGVLLLGNLQTGKTTLFNQLCGQRGREIDIPESSLTLVQGELTGGVRERTLLALLSRKTGEHDEPRKLVYDTPGTATLFPQTDEEQVARDALLHLRPSSLLLVADAKSVRRSLALAIHASELGLPMVLAVNMSDEASRQGIGVDTTRLAERLGIDVVATTAVEDEGIEQIRRCLAAPKVPRRQLVLPEAITKRLAAIEAVLEHLEDELPVSAAGLALLLLSGDREAKALVEQLLDEADAKRIAEEVRAWHTTLHVPPQVILTDLLYDAAEIMIDDVVVTRPGRRSSAETFGQLAAHPVWGVLIAAFVVTLMYYFVGVLGATLVVDTLDRFLFEGLLLPLSAEAVSYIPWQIVRDAIMDPDFGLLPTGLFLAFGIVLPVLFFFFLAFGLLQSSGYLARLSVLLDRVFRQIGLNGKGVMPLVMGFSCVTMALITTRMLESRKERIIASFLLLLGFPCAPLLGVMLVVLGDMPVSATLTVFGFLLVQVIVAGVLANKLVPGLSPDFIMVMPPMRLPRLGFVLRQTVRQTYEFMKEALPLFILASFVLFVFDRIGGLALFEQVTRPLTQGLLGLPDQAVQVFIKTMIRRENGAAELARVADGFTNLQLVVTLVVMALILPCVNSFIVLIKERGLKTSLIIVGVILVYAVVVGALLSRFCLLMGIDFSEGIGT